MELGVNPMDESSEVGVRLAADVLVFALHDLIIPPFRGFYTQTGSTT